MRESAAPPKPRTFEQDLRERLADEYNAELTALHKAGDVAWFVPMKPSGFDYCDEWNYQFVWRKLVESERKLAGVSDAG